MGAAERAIPLTSHRKAKTKLPTGNTTDWTWRRFLSTTTMKYLHGSGNGA